MVGDGAAKGSARTEGWVRSARHVGAVRALPGPKGPGEGKILANNMRRSEPAYRLLVVISTLRDFQRRGGGAIDQSVLAVDPARPEAGQIALQRFRLARALKRMAQTFPDQAIDLPHHRLVGRLPVKELFPGDRAKDKVHSRAIASSSAMVLTTPRPASAIAASSAALLAGLASR